MLNHCKKTTKALTPNDCVSCIYLSECREEYIKKNAQGIDNIHTHDLGSAIKDVGNKYSKMEERYTGGCVTNLIVGFLILLIVYAIGMIFGG